MHITVLQRTAGGPVERTVEAASYHWLDHQTLVVEQTDGSAETIEGVRMFNLDAPLRYDGLPEEEKPSSYHERFSDDTLTISDVIALLEACRAEHGDRYVYYDNNGGSQVLHAWPMPAETLYRGTNHWGRHYDVYPERIILGAVLPKALREKRLRESLFARLDAMIGRPIESLSIDDDGFYLRLRVGDETLLLFNDPCGQTHNHFHSDDDLTYYTGATLLGFTLREGPTVEVDDYDTVRLCSFLTIRTSRGVASVCAYSEGGAYYAGVFPRFYFEGESYYDCAVLPDDYPVTPQETV